MGNLKGDGGKERVREGGCGEGGGRVGEGDGGKERERGQVLFNFYHISKHGSLPLQSRMSVCLQKIT